MPRCALKSDEAVVVVLILPVLKAQHRTLAKVYFHALVARDTGCQADFMAQLEDEVDFILHRNARESEPRLVRHDRDWFKAKGISAA